MNQPVIVVLSKYPDIFAGFRESVDQDAPEVGKVVLWDNPNACGSRVFNEWPHWSQVDSGHDFHMAQNANDAWQRVPYRDLVYCGDDVRIIEPDTIKRLQALAYSDPAIGIASPRIKDQDSQHEGDIEIVPFVTFPMAYIKAEVIAKVGYLDESFTGYGWEDIDYCVRVRQAGYKLAYANNIWIQHGGIDGHRFGTTFRRTGAQIEQDMHANMKRFAEKWGVEPTSQAVWEFVRGDGQANLRPTI